MPTKISDLTAYDGDQLDGPEVLPLVETDEGQTEKITVAQLFGNAPSTTVNGTFTHSPSSDSTSAAEFQDKDGNPVLSIDTNGDYIVLGESGQGEIRPRNNDLGLGFGGTRLKVGRNVITTERDIKPINDNNLTLGGSGSRWSNLYLGQAIKDGNDNELLDFLSNASAVNHLQVENAASGDPVNIEGVGDDSNIDIAVSPLNSGKFIINGNAENPTIGFQQSLSASTDLLLSHYGGGAWLREETGSPLRLGTGGSEFLRGDASQNTLLQSQTSQPGDASAPVLQMGDSGAGFFINSSGEIVAVDEAGNTTVLS